MDGPDCNVEGKDQGYRTGKNSIPHFQSASINDFDRLLTFYLNSLYLSNIGGFHMNKLDLITVLKDEAQITKTEAGRVANLFFDTMTDALERGDRVEVRGLCSFYVKKYRAYTGRNPKTGKKVKIKSKKLPYFKCGKELKERVDYPQTRKRNKQ
jgi:integration host factor subunit beta